MESTSKKSRITNIYILILFGLLIYGFGVLTGFMVFKTDFTVKKTGKVDETHQKETLESQPIALEQIKETLGNVDICPLINYGSLCYFNTLIQCIYSFKDLKDFFMSDSEMTEVKQILKELFERMNAKDKTINTKDILKRIVDLTPGSDFADLNEHQDIHELYIKVINGCLNPNFDASNIVSSDIFDDSAANYFIFRKLYFLIRISSKESNNSTENIQYEPENALLLPTEKFNINRDITEYFKKTYRKKKSDKDEDIEVETTKEAIRYPDVLVIYSPYHETKIPDEIDIHRNIELPPNIKYRLISFGCHLGTPEFGHYIAIRRIKEDIWAIINDNGVSYYTWEDILKYLNQHKIKPTLSFLQKI